MNLRITFFGGRQEQYDYVRYTSMYIQRSSGPMMMRIEFIDSIEPSKSIDLDTVENITVVNKDSNNLK